MASLLAKDFWSGNTPAAVRIRNSWLAKMDKWTQNTITSQKKSFKKYMNNTFFPQAQSTLTFYIIRESLVYLFVGL